MNMIIKDMKFSYKNKTQKYTAKVIEPEIILRIGFWIDTGSDEAYLCELEKAYEGWELYIYYTGVNCHLNTLCNIQENSRKIARQLNNKYNDGTAIATALREVYNKSKDVMY